MLYRARRSRGGSFWSTIRAPFVQGARIVGDTAGTVVGRTLGTAANTGTSAVMGRGRRYGRRRGGASVQDALAAIGVIKRRLDQAEQVGRVLSGSGRRRVRAYGRAMSSSRFRGYALPLRRGRIPPTPNGRPYFV